MRPIKYLPLIAVASLLGACTMPGPVRDLNVAEVRELPQMGNDFQKALHHDYVALAQLEIDENHPGATSYFDTKARESAAGGRVMPTSMSERTIPDENVRELTEAHTNLMRILDAGGASRATEPSARAQTQFDCWMEEQEENFQPDDIARCRSGFLSALDEASGILFAVAEPEPAPAPIPVPAPLHDVAVFTFHFAHNSSVLDKKSLSMKNAISDRIKETLATTVTVRGYTDRSGSRDYNRLLAERRAAAVAEAIKDTGIKPEIDSVSFGEDRPAVQTADGVREWENRRVTVTLKR